MKKGIIWIVVIALVVFVGVSLNKKPTETGPIKIGLIGPFSGDAAAYGEPMRNSVDLAVNEINSAGGVSGRQIEMIYEDSKCSGKDAVSAAQKLVNVDKVKYIIGGICSGEVFGEIPVTSPAKVLVITPGASAAKLSGISEYFLRNNPNDAITGVVLAEYLAKSYKAVAILSEQSEYAQGIRDVFVSQTQKDNLSIVANENFGSDTTDFRSILAKIKNTNPDVIFINPQVPQNTVRIAQQARQLGITVQFVGTFFGSDKTVYSAGSATEGMIFVDLAGLSTDKGKEFVNKYKDMYKTVPPFEYYAGASYDDVYLLSQAISAVGDDATRVQKYLHSMKSYAGVIGTYSFDKNGDMTGAGLILQKVSGGKVIDL